MDNESHLDPSGRASKSRMASSGRLAGARRAGLAYLGVALALLATACADALDPLSPDAEPAAAQTDDEEMTGLVSAPISWTDQLGALAAAVDDALDRLVPAMPADAAEALTGPLTELQERLRGPDQSVPQETLARVHAAVERYATTGVAYAPELDGIRLIVQRAGPLARIRS